MHVRKVNLGDGLSLLRPLLQRAGSAEGSAGWFETLSATTLSPGEQAVMAVLAEGDDAALAGLPLVERPDRSLRALTAPYTTLYAPPLGSPDAAEALARGLRPLVRGRLVLDALDPADPTVAGLVRGLAAGGLAAARYRHFANWHEEIPSFEAYWAGRPSDLKETVRRKSRKLERDSRLRFACFTAPEDMADAAAIYETIYAESWKEPEPDPDFIGTMLRSLAEEGAARVGIAYIDEAPAAAAIWLVRHRHATIFKLAHRSTQDRHSPGTLLSHWLLKRLVENEGIATIDFGRGNDSYKRQWMGQCRDRIGLIAADPLSPRGLATAFRHIWPMRLRQRLNGGKE